MILSRLKTFFIKPAKNSVGKMPPHKVEKITECYAKLDVRYRSQGDVYPASAFSGDAFPIKEIGYWGIINRTCHLYESTARQIKLPFLTYAAVYPLHDVVNKDRNIKEQVSNIVHGKVENLLLLPANSEQYSVGEPLVFNFNLLFTLPVAKCPPAADKCIQLSSPFCEHAFQKLARYFYTVGYDDEQIKSSENVAALVEYVKSKS